MSELEHLADSVAVVSAEVDVCLIHMRLDNILVYLSLGSSDACEIVDIAAYLEVDDIGINFAGVVIRKAVVYLLYLLSVLDAVFIREQTAARYRYIGNEQGVFGGYLVDLVDYLLITCRKSKYNYEIVDHFFYFRQLVYAIALKGVTAHEIIACENT